MRFLKWAFLSFSLGSVLLALLFLYQDDESLLQQVAIASLSAGLSIDRPVILEQKAGENIWRLLAEKAIQEERGVKLQKPSLQIYLKSGEQVLITGHSGLFDTNKRNMRFNDDVLLVYQDWRIHCQELRYDSMSDAIIVPGAFQAEEGSMIITASGLRLLRQSELLSMAKDVHIRDTNAERWKVLP